VISCTILGKEKVGYTFLGQAAKLMGCRELCVCTKHGPGQFLVHVVAL